MGVEAAGSLTDAQIALVGLSAALGGRDRQAWRPALLEAAKRADARAVEETILQAHLFVGFPVTLNALILWRELAGAGPPPAGETDLETWRRVGQALCRRVYGDAYERLRENVRALHPDLDRWMVETGYGRTLSRPGLDPVTRELCIVAVLAAGAHERQLRAHLRGALNLGASSEAIGAAVDLAGTEVGRRVWGDVRHRVAPPAGAETGSEDGDRCS